MRRREINADVQAANRKLVIMNIIIAVLSLGVILTLMFANFWTVSLTLKPGEMLNGVLENMMGEGNEPDFDIGSATEGLEIKLAVGSRFKHSSHGILYGMCRSR